MTSHKPPNTIAIVGCGYVGSALARALIALGRRVLGTTTTPARCDALANDSIEPVVLTLSDKTAVRDLLNRCDAAVLCMAPNRNARDYRAVYLDGIRHVVDAIAGTPITRIIYTSSTRVYGFDDGRWVDETTPPQPADDNGAILLAAEQALLEGIASQSHSRETTATVLRLGGIHGPGRDLIDRAKRLTERSPSGGRSFVNLSHRDDIVTAIVKLLDIPHDGVLNCVGNDPRTRRDLYDGIVTAHGLAAIQWSDLGNESRGKRVRNERIKKLLGLDLRAH